MRASGEIAVGVPEPVPEVSREPLGNRGMNDVDARYGACAPDCIHALDPTAVIVEGVSVRWMAVAIVAAR